MLSETFVMSCASSLCGFALYPEHEAATHRTIARLVAAGLVTVSPGKCPGVQIVKSVSHVAR